MYDVLSLDLQSGDGKYTKLCNSILKLGAKDSTPYLTTSCTHSLEMAALLLDIQPGDEVIMPSFTFVSTANAFLLRGAKIIFCDSQKNNPNLDINHAESLITSRTKSIVPVHYGGIACQMDELVSLGKLNNIKIIEDAAQGIGAFYKNKPLGTIGDIGCLSFHDTKNISCGEGGAIFINDLSLKMKAEIVREKGTNRAAYFRGEINKYGWKSLGSSYLLSDILAAKLLSQLEELESITQRRKQIWNTYYQEFSSLEKQGKCYLPDLPNYADHNGHMFYLVCNNGFERNKLLSHLKRNDIQSTFHYLSLHKSDYFKDMYKGGSLPNSDRFTDCLLRLPLHLHLKSDNQKKVIDKLKSYFN
jgi:dTDP-4-amino-4,6-dideoxygalactose transaminase